MIARLADRSGQSTVEYALVAAALSAIVLGLGALWRFASDGSVSQALARSLTHTLPSGVLDVLAF
mgnify:FL=1